MIIECLILISTNSEQGLIYTVIERAKRAHSLFMSIEISDIYIGIYVRVVQVFRNARTDTRAQL